VLKPNGTVVFQVEVERGGAWARVSASAVMRGGESKDVGVPIAGATRLRLLTTDAGDNIHQASVPFRVGHPAS